MDTKAYEELIGSMPGCVVEGQHKNPDKPSKRMALEVTAVAAVPTKYGTKTYLLGTIVDDTKNAGRVVAVKAAGFNLRTVNITKAEGFKPADLSRRMFRDKDADEAMDHFSFFEEVADEDREFALESGMRPAADFIVAGVKPKATRKPRAPKVA